LIEFQKLELNTGDPQGEPPNPSEPPRDLVVDLDVGVGVGGKKKGGRGEKKGDGKGKTMVFRSRPYPF